MASNCRHDCLLSQCSFTHAPAAQQGSAERQRLPPSHTPALRLSSWHMLQDTNLTADARKQYAAAAAAAQQHHQHIQQLLQQQASSTAGAAPSSRRSRSSSSSCWPAVQTAAHHVLATYRAVTLRLQQLTCLLEARDKLLHQIQQVQVQQQPRGISPQRAANNGSGRRRELDAGVLTAFELHLLSHPALLQQHWEALSEAVGLLQQQQECRQHAAVFFAWVASAVTEVQQQLQGSPASAATGSSAASKPGASKQQHQQRQQESAEQVLPAPPMQDLLPLVQQLPSVNTQLAAGVLGRVHAQLQSAATAAVVVQPSSTDHTAPDLTCCTVGTAAEHQQQAWQLHRGVTGACTQAAAAALLQSGVLPAADIQELQPLPDDIHTSLQRLRDLQATQEQQQQGQLATQQQVQHWTSLRHCWQDPQQQKRRQPQQRQQQARPAGAGAPGLAGERAACGLSADSLGSSGVDGTQAAVDSSGAEAGVGSELQRLSSLALHVAKLLAKARAANKQQLAAAAQVLLECGGEEGVEGGQLVLYMS